MYKYDEIRPTLFTETGQRLFLRVRDNVREILAMAGAVRADAKRATSGVETADPWEVQACFDRMVELEELREVAQPSGTYLQRRIFVGRGG